MTTPTPTADTPSVAISNQAVFSSPDTPALSESVTTAVPTSTEWNVSQLFTLIDAGGPVIVILAVMSVIAMSVFILKLGQFLFSGMNQHKPLAIAIEQWRDQDSQSALNTLNNTRNPIARVLEIAISLKVEHRLEDSLIREEVMRIAKRQLANARSHLRILELIATLSPLLGLLGTVLGMITAFQKLQGAGTAVDPSILSGGIWEALLTTAAGLIVAIPTVVALNWLEQKIEYFKLSLEDAMTQIFTVTPSAYDKSVSVLQQHKKTKHSARTPIKSQNNDARKPDLVPAI